MIKAIETQYGGYKFRSRLEARWAIFFDTMKIKYDYEPEGFDLGNGIWYLPDFYLPEHKLWIEIKPTEPDDGERLCAHLLSVGKKQPVFIVCGPPGISMHRNLAIADKHSIEVFAGNNDDFFPTKCPMMEYVMGDERFDSLAEFLAGKFGLPIRYDGTGENRLALIELDRKYYMDEYGVEHPIWVWGRWMNGMTLSLHNGAVIAECGILSRIVNTPMLEGHLAGQQARF